MAAFEVPIPDLTKLRERKKQRERVEAAVRVAVGKMSFDEASQRLRAAGVGFTEVLPLERVLDAPQAHQPGKLRELDFRGLHFEVPEFPGQSPRACEPGLPPPQIGEHSRELLGQLGFAEAEQQRLVDEGAIMVGGDSDFAWVPVRTS